MQRRKVLAFFGIVAVALIAFGGNYIYSTLSHASADVNTLPNEAKAALSQTVNGMGVPGVIVPTNWQISSSQLASAPAQLASQKAIQGQIQSVWCIVIAPTVNVLATKRTPATDLSHFLAVKSTMGANSLWVAISADSVPATSSTTLFTKLGCTNG